MNILISDLEFENCKSREKIPLKCYVCNNIFYRTKHEIQSAKTSVKSGCLTLCSKQCRKISNDKKINISCRFCKKIIKRKQSEIKNNKFSFCSRSCSANYWNHNKTWGSCRSKLEKWIEEQLTKLYPALEIHYNKTDTINAELDIYIPSLKLAFELNGIFHYELIYNKDKLKRTQNNDQRKIQACSEKSIGLCVIDTSFQKYFKENNSKKFLNIITNIINSKKAEDTGIEPVCVLPQL